MVREILKQPQVGRNGEPRAGMCLEDVDKVIGGGGQCVRFTNYKLSKKTNVWESVLKYKTTQLCGLGLEDMQL